MFRFHCTWFLFLQVGWGDGKGVELACGCLGVLLDA